ncbi:MAG TPA: rod-binding protein [Sandaracinaceae bacterium LLY-WYZ-13_1]|nr:rod-binding protein [Sandaracinaceae bacterium LLY-WYZ-13_1]
MTVGLPTAIPGPQVPEDATPEQRRQAQVRHAATQFEGLLIQQLVSVMRSTVGEGGMFGSGAGSSMYAHLFDQSFADSMASAGGLGMRSVLERSMLGPAAYAAQQAQADGQSMDTAPLRPTPFEPRAVGEVLEVRPPTGAPLAGPTGRLQQAARAMLGPDGHAPQWGRDGRLTERDLASDFVTEGPEGVATFNVRDAAGFEGAYKCNLFAFELARRAGFQVPLIGRTRGWGYMGPDGVTADAVRGRLRGDWGRVVTGESAESLDSGVVRGERAFLLTGDSVGDRAGHMGIVERVHEVDYDEQGRIERIVFDGWEGRSRGARHLERRTWNRYGNPGGEDARGGFERIEIIELRRPEAGTQPETPVHANAHPSVHDLERLAREDGISSSRSAPGRPNQRVEESPP